MTRKRRFLLQSLALPLLLCGAPYGPARGDVAHLRNGRTLAVSGFRIDRDRIVLLIEGGGEVAVPSNQVLSIERLPEDKQAPSLSAPAPAGPAGERLVAPVAPAPPPAASVIPARTVLEPVAETRPEDRASLRDLATRTARKYGVDARLVLAVIEVESRYDVRAVSPRGAMGLMQLMPQTAARFAVRDPYNPSENVEAGVRYLKELLDRYSGQPRLALAAYNAGEEAVEHFSGIPPFQETIHYVERVLRAVPR
jgi:hypothetical protein